MKNIILVMLFSLCVSGVWSSSAQATPDVAKMQQEMTEVITSAVSALELQNVGDDDSYWPLKRFLLRLQLKFGIEVPIFAKFEVIPEIEMVFIKTN